MREGWDIIEQDFGLPWPMPKAPEMDGWDG